MLRLLLQVILSVHLAAAAPAPDDGWEHFDDDSMGKAVEYHGIDGIVLPAYVRKPAGDGPFPVIVLAHGGVQAVGAAMGLGRSTKPPTEDFIQAGFAVYSIDYRPAEKIAIVPIEIDDTVEAVKAAKALPFVDPNRVGYLGGSHGAQLGSRVVSRVDMKGAVLCAPAAMELIEVKKAFGRGEQLVSILNKLVGDMETKYGAPAEEIEKDPAKYGYSSAFTEVAQVRCPILIVNGKNDNNSPVSIIDEYVKRLRAAGKEVETYLPDNAPHGFYFGRPDIPETKEAARRAVAFFQKQFGEKVTTASAPATTAAPAASKAVDPAPGQGGESSPPPSKARSGCSSRSPCRRS
ncbi:MAG: prolyl oligopeptidase family serine peptidase, partial [Candidatus Sumerlaeota bacterium]|nr:prolyl oligopeptidase family serine peptidase [Candidatus Sumerlaeota bacterium]